MMFVLKSIHTPNPNRTQSFGQLYWPFKAQTPALSVLEQPRLSALVSLQSQLCNVNKSVVREVNKFKHFQDCIAGK